MTDIAAGMMDPMMMGGGMPGMPGMGGMEDENAAGKVKDVRGDGSVVKEVLEAGEQYGRSPEDGDECVVTWQEVAGEALPSEVLDAALPDECVVSSGDRAVVVLGEGGGGEGGAPAGVVAALRTMASGEVAKVTLRGGVQSLGVDGPTCCRVELASYWRAEDVSEEKDGRVLKKRVGRRAGKG